MRLVPIFSGGFEVLDEGIKSQTLMEAVCVQLNKYVEIIALPPIYGIGRNEPIEDNRACFREHMYITKARIMKKLTRWPEKEAGFLFCLFVAMQALNLQDGWLLRKFISRCFHHEIINTALQK